MKNLTIIFLFLTSVVFSQDEVPNVTLNDLNGEGFDVRSFSEDGQLTVISLWATWCVPCLKELDAINDVYPDWQEETGVQLVAISIDDARTQKRVRPLINGKGWPYKILLDENHDFKRAIGAASVPLTLLVKNNKVLYRHSGYSPGAEDELYEKIKEYSK
ncbi:MAG: TlpA family protein disulfide reductase [Mesonia hippocampi]|uniref:Peroxiredoxin n=1 Tax=Mesonia hippocampi TaxID=1628250 RepID=A0A840ESB0_9FLAO|nr:TlpA disulfide reductase family protein [Mesonia hippocampi]MBB4119935.1 peroxiredoxin [Mesonia hippocampi]